MISLKPGPKMLLEPLPEVAQDQWFEAAFEDGFGSNGLMPFLRVVLEGFRKTIGVRDPAAGDRDSGVGVRGSEAGLRGSRLGFDVLGLGFEVLGLSPKVACLSPRV